jgi:hypothetical protein
MPSPRMCQGPANDEPSRCVDVRVRKGAASSDPGAHNHTTNHHAHLHKPCSPSHFVCAIPIKFLDTGLSSISAIEKMDARVKKMMIDVAATMTWITCGIVQQSGY